MHPCPNQDAVFHVNEQAATEGNSERYQLHA